MVLTREQIAELKLSRKDRKSILIWEDLPELKMEGQIEYVIRVGTTMTGYPCITLRQEGDKEVVYRLPLVWSPWAFDSVACAHMTPDMFPTRAKFSADEIEYLID